MAEFCLQCHTKLIGPDPKENDFVGISTEQDTKKDFFVAVLCEGCGPTLVDHTGKCVMKGCLENHNDQD